MRSIVTNAARVRPIVTCGACGQDNVQRVLSTTLHFLTTVGALVAIGALAYDRATGLRAVPMLVALFFIVEIAWWHVAAHLEKVS